MVENLAEKDDKLDQCEKVLDEEINVESEAEDNNNLFDCSKCDHDFDSNDQLRCTSRPSMTNLKGKIQDIA